MAGSKLSQVLKDHDQANGLALVISNDYKTTEGLRTLEGTIKDSMNMERTFESLNLAVIKEHNVTCTKMEGLIHSLVTFRHYPPSYKRIVFVFSGHGAADYLLYTNDKHQTTISIKEILEQFSDVPHLAKMPKVFFIDACRGEQTNPGLMVPKGGKPVSEIVPAEGNYLVAYSTLPKHKSYEEHGKGGVWMSTLAEKLRTQDSSLADILTSVNSEMVALYNREATTYPLQQPEFTSRLNSNIFFLREARDWQSIGQFSVGATGETKLPAHQLHRATTCNPTTKPEPATKPPTKQEVNPAHSLPASRKAKPPPVKKSVSVPQESVPKGASATAGLTNPRDKLEWYANVKGKKKPVITAERVKTTRKYIGRAYIPQTCGWVDGEPKRTKAEAEHDAAVKLVARLKI